MQAATADTLAYYLWPVFLRGGAARALFRSSSRKSFGALSVAIVIVIRGNPAACSRRNVRTRGSSFFQHSRSHVPTARWTQNSPS